MISKDDFRLATLQAVIFTPDIAAFDKTRFIAGVLRRHADRYNGEIETLPIQVSDPKFSALHVVEINSRDSQWTLKAAPVRIDSFWKRLRDVRSVFKADILREAVHPLLEYVRDGEIHVGRMALVLQRYCATASPPQALIERFCRDQTWDTGNSSAPFRNSQSFEIHNHKRYPLVNNLIVNSWVRCRTGTGEDQPAVLVEQDINTLNEEMNEKAFRDADIDQFFQSAVAEADKILDLYFPKTE